MIESNYPLVLDMEYLLLFEIFADFVFLRVLPLHQPGKFFGKTSAERLGLEPRLMRLELIVLPLHYRSAEVSYVSINWLVHRATISERLGKSQLFCQLNYRPKHGTAERFRSVFLWMKNGVA